jgi:integrase
MRSLGYRYAEDRFRHFDAFLQTRPGAASTPFAVLVQEYAAAAATPGGHLRRLTVGRALASTLRRVEPDFPGVARDPLVRREAARLQRRPYIFAPAEIERVLATAREFPSPHAPLRPRTLYTMLVLAYCVGLRLGEIVRLQVRDLRWAEQALDIRESKFFKSRRLPVAASTLAVLQQYWAARRAAGIPEAPETPLFCHRGGGYGHGTAGHLLCGVLRAAGLKPGRGRVGPRLHDLRHSFVVHRMLAWYREGVDPQAKLPYLWTYLGHRGLSSSLVYLTITQELLHQASERFRAFAAPGLASVAEGP